MLRQAFCFIVESFIVYNLLHISFIIFKVPVAFSMKYCTAAQNIEWHGNGNLLKKIIMENSKTADLINDLIEINNDRVAGFEKATADIKDENIDLKAIFQRYAEQSRKNGQELAALVSNYGKVENGKSVTGSLHRAWIDVKSVFGGSDRAGILSEAERGEDAIKKAYNDALTSGELPVDVSTVVSEQAAKIKMSHDEVKALRDAAKISS